MWSGIYDFNSLYPESYNTLWQEEILSRKDLHHFARKFIFKRIYHRETTSDIFSTREEQETLKAQEDLMEEQTVKPRGKFPSIVLTKSQKFPALSLYPHIDLFVKLVSEEFKCIPRAIRHDNCTHQQSTAIKEWSQINDVVIKPSDKGDVVIWPKGMNKREAFRQLCDSTCYKRLTFNPLIETLPSYLRDTTDILRKMNGIYLEPDMTFVTCDVESLYTSIHHSDGLEAESYFLHTSEDDPDLGPPENITLTWQGGDMVIQTSDVQFVRPMSIDCFKLFLELKSSKEMEQRRTFISSECSKTDSLPMFCQFSDPNLDPEKCFYIRLQFQTNEVCTHIYESEWSDTIFMKNYSLVESCHVQKPTAFGVMDSHFIILFSAISILVIFVIIFLRCHMERLKNCIFPIVPDPKNSFHNLFESHNGYFEEWVKTADNDIHQEELECVMDEQKDEPASTYVKENEVMMPINQPVIGEQEDNVTPASVALQEEATNVFFGNINFTMNESMYVRL
ncbi:uncharacterized protein LOC142741772 [Rhinoderma darwinii]|uniref:uncharacterized protein LOC142741772 n=1 Tax=Rhinoderma darwinii TaxID=43563 RepID=UPI003F67249E